jgi:hypothetical protein
MKLGIVVQVCNPSTLEADHKFQPSLGYTVKPCIKKSIPNKIAIPKFLNGKEI